jgi:transposase
MTTSALMEAQLTVGVDTHADVHVAAAIDQMGRLIATHSVAATPSGYRALVAWASGLGMLERFGIEGTGSYGAGLVKSAASWKVRCD